MKPSLEFAYGIALVATAHLILIRIPLKGKPGKRRGACTKGELSKAYRGMMRDLGIKKDDWLSLDWTSHPDSWDEAATPLATPGEIERQREHALKFEEAFGGEPRFAEFYLFDYRGGAFVKVRDPLKTTPS